MKKYVLFMISVVFMPCFTQAESKSHPSATYNPFDTKQGKSTDTPEAPDALEPAEQGEASSVASEVGAALI